MAINLTPHTGVSVGYLSYLLFRDSTTSDVVYFRPHQINIIAPTFKIFIERMVQRWGIYRNAFLDKSEEHALKDMRVLLFEFGEHKVTFVFPYTCLESPYHFFGYLEAYFMVSYLPIMYTNINLKAVNSHEIVNSNAILKTYLKESFPASPPQFPHQQYFPKIVQSHWQEPVKAPSKKELQEKAVKEMQHLFADIQTNPEKYGVGQDLDGAELELDEDDFIVILKVLTGFARMTGSTVKNLPEEFKLTGDLYYEATNLLEKLSKALPKLAAELDKKEKDEEDEEDLEF